MILRSVIFFFACTSALAIAATKTSLSSFSPSSSSSSLSSEEAKSLASHESRSSIHSWSSIDTEPDEQLHNSVELVYNTLFQNIDFLDTVGLSEFKDEVDEQALLLRRLYLLFLLGEIKYKTHDGKISSWPFPLATVLTQGQRIFIMLDGIKPEEFLDFITGGHSDMFHKRAFSSHGIKLNTNTGEMEEVKIKNPLRRIKSTELVLGMNFPFGGVGSPLPNGAVVGPRGWEIVDGRLSKKNQLGHLHLYAQYFPEINQTGVLIGIESCAPNSKNQFGCNHNLFSGLKNQKLNRSVSGGMKWGEMTLPSPIPAEYGGKFLRISREDFNHHNIKYKVKTIVSAWDLARQEDLFSKILPVTGAEGIKILKKDAPTYFWG